MATQLSNISDDIIWAITRRNNTFLVKGRTQDGTQFSRDPLNLLNINARSVSGFANSKAIGIAGDSEGRITVTRKKTKDQHQPAKATNQLVFGKFKSNRKVYKSLAGITAKTDYLPKHNLLAIQRASSLRRSTRPTRPTPASKPRGKKAQVAAKNGSSDPA